MGRNDFVVKWNSLPYYITEFTLKIVPLLDKSMFKISIDCIDEILKFMTNDLEA